MANGDEVPPTDIGHVLAAQAAASMYQTAAVIMALAQRGLVDPLDVVKNAEYFASSQQSVQQPEEISRHIVDQLTMFATLIRAMATVPPNAGHG